jgi:hypothetical protein
MKKAERSQHLAGSDCRFVTTCVQLAGKQVGLLALRIMTLPRLHYAIGKRIARLAEPPADLVPYCDRIRSIEAALTSRPTTQLGQKCPSLANNARQLVRQLLQAVTRGPAAAAAQIQIQSAYWECGKEAVQLYGHTVVPNELKTSWSVAEERCKQLVNEIAGLQGSTSEWGLTPQRVVSAGGSLAGILLALFLLRSVGVFVFGSGNTGVQARTSRLAQIAADPNLPAKRPPEVSQFDAAIRSAIAGSLGRESRHFEAKTFRGLQLGDQHEDEIGKCNAAFEAPHFLSVPPHKAIFGSDGKPEETRVIVEKANNRIVGVTCVYYDTSISELLPALLDIFGKTSQEIEVRQWQQGGGPARADTIKYTFPHTIVRVSGFSYSRGSPSNLTRIAVFDRPFIEKCLLTHGESVIQSCLWLKQMRRLASAGQIDAKDSLPLKGCEIQAFRPEDGEILLYVDTKREHDLKTRVKSLENPREESGFGRGGVLQPFDVALYARSSRGKQLIVCPDASGAMRVPELKMYSEHLDGSILTTPILRDLVLAFTSVIVQGVFPPEGDSIDVITQSSDTRWDPDFDVSVDTRVRQISSRANGDRHEWNDRDGWQVRVTERGAISLVWRQGRGL